MQRRCFEEIKARRDILDTLVSTSNTPFSGLLQGRIQYQRLTAVMGHWIARYMAMLMLASQSLAQDTRQRCHADTFSGLDLFGGEILGVSAQYYVNLTFGPEYFLQQVNYFPMNVSNLDVCEVNVTYTHPGQNDTITAIMWLPEDWNGRFMGVGGGGWGTGQGRTTLHRPAADGYAAIITDGGHSMEEVESSPRFWALTSTGNVDWALLQDFAAIALDDAATLGKDILRAFYGRQQTYSYWNGCSGGGRQGYMMAQRYPEQYDGILATAPAIYWSQFIMAEYWPQLIMNELSTVHPFLSKSFILT